MTGMYHDPLPWLGNVCRRASGVIHARHGCKQGRAMHGWPGTLQWEIQCHKPTMTGEAFYKTQWWWLVDTIVYQCLPNHHTHTSIVMTWWTNHPQKWYCWVYHALPHTWGWVKTLVPFVHPKIAGIYGCSSHIVNISIGIFTHTHLNQHPYPVLSVSQHLAHPLPSAAIPTTSAPLPPGLAPWPRSPPAHRCPAPWPKNSRPDPGKPVGKLTDQTMMRMLVPKFFGKTSGETFQSGLADDVLMFFGSLKTAVKCYRKSCTYMKP